MITPAVKQTAFLFLERRSHLPAHKQAMWLWYFFSENDKWKHHVMENKLDRDECTQLVRAYIKEQENVRENRDTDKAQSK